MTLGRIYHALGLHMHQPPGNLATLAEANPHEAEEIIRCYERVPRFLKQYPDVGRIHVGFSGVLLEQMRDKRTVDAYRHWVDLPAALNNYAEADNIELIGMGYYHPLFPLIPTDDWLDQLIAGRQILKDTFGREPRGFWPPEMAFCMEMVPYLVKAGYEYVVVDGVHVHPENDAPLDLYKPHVACRDGYCITVIPRQRDISNAQESGLNASWFADEVRNKIRESPDPGADRLVTTWSDGENGNWFRNQHEPSSFFGHFFAPYMEHVRVGEYPVRPIAISEYLETHRPDARAHVETGAWNVGNTSGFDFSQWAGSEPQREAVEALYKLSGRYHALADSRTPVPDSFQPKLKQARDHILEAETSCFLFWGDEWVPFMYQRTNPAESLIAEVENGLARHHQPPGPRLSGPPAKHQADPPVAQAAPESLGAEPAEPAKAAGREPDNKAHAEPQQAPAKGAAPPDTEPRPAEKPAKKAGGTRSAKSGAAKQKSGGQGGKAPNPTAAEPQSAPAKGGREEGTAEGAQPEKTPAKGGARSRGSSKSGTRPQARPASPGKAGPRSRGKGSGSKDET